MSSRRVAVAVAVFLLLCATAGFTSSTDLVSGGPGGVSDGASGWPSIGNCRELTAFESDATNLVEGDTNGVTDVFASTPCCPVFPGSAGTGRLSVSAAGAEGNGPSRHPAMDALGTSVAYESLASNLVDGDTNDASDIFMTAVGCDDGSGSWEPTTARVSLTAAGEQADGASTYPSVGGNGLIVAFESVATNLVEGDTNGVSDIFVRDRDLGTTLRVSVSSEGGEANGPSHLPVVSADGRFVVFISEATNLVPDDTNGVADVFIRDLGQITGLLNLLLMMVSPIAWTEAMFSDAFKSAPALVMNLLKLNPLYYIIISYQRAILLGDPPSWPLLGTFAAAAALLFFGGYKVFSALQQVFVENV